MLDTLVLKRVIVASFMTMAMACAACTPMATWPPTEGKAVLAPSAAPCPQLMATSVSFTRRNTNPQAPLVFNLPPGTEWKVWEEVLRQLGPDARKMVPGDAPVFDVRQVRLDGGLAEVDVVYATREGVWQMATVRFTGAFGSNYRPNYFQHWFIPVEVPVCHSPPRPPPPLTIAWPSDDPVGESTDASSSESETAPSDSSSGA